MLLLIPIILMSTIAQYLIKGRKRKGIENEVVNEENDGTPLAELSSVLKYWVFFSKNNREYIPWILRHSFNYIRCKLRDKLITAGLSDNYSSDKENNLT